MLLENKNALIFGLANQRSIASAIAQKFKDQGANLAISYAAENLLKRVKPLSESLEAELLFKCDLNNDQDIKAGVELVKEKWSQVDILVHSVAFAPSEELQGRFLDTSRQGFVQTMETSVYSLIALCREYEPLLSPDAAIVSMTYLGSQKVIANYNVLGVAKAALESAMRYLASEFGPKGIRVNAISAGPIKTLSAAGISGFRKILSHIEEKSALKRNIDQEDAGNTAVFLASDLSRSITGEIIYVDSGYNIMGI